MKLSLVSTIFIYIPFVHWSFPLEVTNALTEWPINLDEKIFIKELFPALEFPINAIFMNGLLFEFIFYNSLITLSFISFSYKD
jgi:hypothetical protein